ncbi:MAG TPA: universal stress protein [Verrucomicrobiae bacterium]|jgi:glycine betaine transporter
MNAQTKTPSVKIEPKAKALRSGPDENSLRIARILVPIDFSEGSKAAIRYATRLAEQFGASIHLAYVIDSLGDLKDGEVVPWNATTEDATLVLKRKIAELANEEIEELVPVYPHVVSGQAYEEIVSLARAFFCDLIIISTHGRTGVSRALIGSVAERVVRHAHCPVLVVRTHERDFA